MWPTRTSSGTAARPAGCSAARCRARRWPPARWRSLSARTATAAVLRPPCAGPRTTTALPRAVALAAPPWRTGLVGGLGGGGRELDSSGEGIGTSTRGSLRRLRWKEGVFFRMTMAVEGWKRYKGEGGVLVCLYGDGYATNALRR